MKPTEKSAGIDTFLKTFGLDRKTAIESETCVLCGAMVNPETSFKDELSLKEYRISGMCQKCQDEIFNDED